MGQARAQRRVVPPLKETVRRLEEKPDGLESSKWVAIFTLSASIVLVVICAKTMTGNVSAVTSPERDNSCTSVRFILVPMVIDSLARTSTAVIVACIHKRVSLSAWLSVQA